MKRHDRAHEGAENADRLNEEITGINPRPALPVSAPGAAQLGQNRPQAAAHRLVHFCNFDPVEIKAVLSSPLRSFASHSPTLRANYSAPRPARPPHTCMIHPTDRSQRQIAADSIRSQLEQTQRVCMHGQCERMIICVRFRYCYSVVDLVSVRGLMNGAHRVRSRPYRCLSRTASNVSCVQ